MRLESLIVGVMVLGFGVVLVTTNGVVAGVNLPGLIGYPSCTNGAGSSNTTPSPQCFGFAGYGVGTIVCLFGLGMIGNGLRSPGIPKGLGAGGGAPTLPPEFAASLAQAQQAMAAAQARGMGYPAVPSAGVRYCSACGKPNAADAQFCQGCGRSIPRAGEGSSTDPSSSASVRPPA